MTTATKHNNVQYIMQRDLQTLCAQPRPSGSRALYEIQRQWFALLKHWGLPVHAHSFLYKTKRLINIWCELQPPSSLLSTAKSSEILVVGAHMDSVPQACGADDNAAACVVLLALVRQVLKSPDVLPCRLLVVWFDGEELGTVGSRRWVQDVSAQYHIKGYINLDMIGSVGWLGYTRIIRHPNDHSLMRGVERILATKTNRVKWLTVQDDIGTSDYAPFQERGIPIWSLSSGTQPWNHGRHDTVDKVHPQSMEMVLVTLVRLIQSICTAVAASITK